MTGELWNSSINYTSQLAVQDIHHHGNCSHPIELADATGNGDCCCFRQEMVIAGVFQAVLWSLKETQGKALKKKKQPWCVWTTSDIAFAVTDDLSDVKQIRWKLFRPHLLRVLPILHGSLPGCASRPLVPELSSCDSSVSLPVPSQSLPSFFSAVLWCCYSPRSCLSTSMISPSSNLKALALEPMGSSLMFNVMTLLSHSLAGPFLQYQSTPLTNPPAGPPQNLTRAPFLCSPLNHGILRAHPPALPIP